MFRSDYFLVILTICTLIMKKRNDKKINNNKFTPIRQIRRELEIETATESLTQKIQEAAWFATSEYKTAEEKEVIPCTITDER